MTRRARLRAEWIGTRGCARCGSKDQLEIDHIDPKTKVADLSSIWTWSKARREVELAKCQVLCKPCHQKKTCRDRGIKAYNSHSAAGYRRGCRCSRCCKGHSKAQASSRSKASGRTPRPRRILTGLALWRLEFDAKRAAKASV